MKNIILFFLFTFNLVSAQENEINSVISKEIKDLTNKGISEFFIVEKYCNGCIKLIKSEEKDCDYGTSKLYVFWKVKNVIYFRKIDKCNSPKVKISEEIFNVFLKNIREIEKENIKMYETAKDNYVSISHSTFTKFHFMYNDKIIIKSYNDFDLTTDDDNPNINYGYNNSLKLIKLSEICEKTIIQNR